VFNSNCKHAVSELSELIFLAIEMKRKQVIGSIGERTYVEYCDSDRVAKKKHLILYENQST
jgi:hypothetical protein